MSEWAVLDLDGDPTPGDPVRVRELAGRLGEQAGLAGRNTGRLRRIASGDTELAMRGDYAPKFRDVLHELPAELAKLDKAYRGASGALSTYASTLSEAKSRAGRALRDGRDADARFQGALREIRSVLPAERQVLLGSGLGLNETVLDTAMLGLDEATKSQVRSAARRARDADADRDTARRLADQAAELRGEAETRCVDGINNALEDSGIKNKTFLEKAWDTVSKPFRSWDDFVELCKAVALVAGVVALFISGPIGWALMAAALVAGAAVLADTLTKYARGQASLGQVALDALGVIPGGRGVASLAKLGMAAKGMAAGLRGGAGRLAGATLRGARAAMRSANPFRRRGDFPPLSRADQDAVARYADDLASRGRTRDVTGTGPAYVYQRRVVGETEYNVAPAGKPDTWADGINRERGLMQDAKYRQGDSSFYDPDSLPPFLRDRAIQDMDQRLVKYRDAIQDSSNPLRGLEIVTNDQRAANFVRQRMDELDVPGVVTISP
jgi:hypothetical protein